jgi:hypothetical protein
MYVIDKYSATLTFLNQNAIYSLCKTFTQEINDAFKSSGITHTIELVWVEFMQDYIFVDDDCQAVKKMQYYYFESNTSPLNTILKQVSPVLLVCICFILSCSENGKIKSKDAIGIHYSDTLRCCQAIMPCDTNYIKGFFNNQPITGFFTLYKPEPFMAHVMDTSKTIVRYICYNTKKKRLGVLNFNINSLTNRLFYGNEMPDVTFHFNDGCISRSGKYLPKKENRNTDFIKLQSDNSSVKGCLNVMLYAQTLEKGLPDSIIFKDIQFYTKK